MHLSSHKFLLLNGIALSSAVSVLLAQQANAQFPHAAASPMVLAQADAPEVDPSELESPEPESPEPESPAAETQQAPTVIDLAASSEAFGILVQALQTAELVDTLSGPGPFTVFAPTDEAFAQLPDGTVEALLQPENRDLLIDILQYHVVDGAVPSDVVTSGPIPTLSEDSLTAEVGDVITVDSATVLQPDAQASNGIIHVIDKVLVPESAMLEVQTLLELLAATEPVPEFEPGLEPEFEPGLEPESAPAPESELEPKP
ncbi:MAG: fasciclin domain-containing protein [Elainellaceae cyanobacterium]